MPFSLEDWCNEKAVSNRCFLLSPFLFFFSLGLLQKWKAEAGVMIRQPLPQIAAPVFLCLMLVFLIIFSVSETKLHYR